MKIKNLCTYVTKSHQVPFIDALTQAPQHWKVPDHDPKGGNLRLMSRHVPPQGIQELLQIFSPVVAHEPQVLCWSS